jgi:hypothetical protein
MYCIYLSVSFLPTAIDPVKQEREELPEPALVEDTNPDQDQGKTPVHLTTSHEIYLLFLLLYDS